MTKALQVHQPGGPDAMRWQDIDVGDPGVGEVRLRHTAVGVNFLDTFHRSRPGVLPSYPAVVGVEGAGHIEAVGDGVAGFAVGDRAAYAFARGSYCEARLIDAAALVRIPDGISDETAAAGITKGITVHHLFNVARKIKAGETILYHAAAGGVGLIACQWGAPSWRHTHRHRRQRLQGGAHQVERRGPRNCLHARRFRRAGEGDHRRARLRRGVRRGWQGHYRGLTQMCRHLRDACHLRRGVGRRDLNSPAPSCRSRRPTPKLPSPPSLRYRICTARRRRRFSH